MSDKIERLKRRLSVLEEQIKTEEQSQKGHVSLVESVMDRLLPCPFCGNKPSLRQGGKEKYWCIECRGGDISGRCPVVYCTDWKTSKLDATEFAAVIQKWNRRSK